MVNLEACSNLLEFCLREAEISENNQARNMLSKRKLGTLEENPGAVEVKMSPAEVRELDDVLVPGSVAGPRYTREMMAQVNR